MQWCIAFCGFPAHPMYIPKTREVPHPPNQTPEESNQLDTVKSTWLISPHDNFFIGFRALSPELLLTRDMTVN